MARTVRQLERKLDAAERVISLIERTERLEGNPLPVSPILEMLIQTLIDLLGRKIYNAIKKKKEKEDVT